MNKRSRAPKRQAKQSAAVAKRTEPAAAAPEIVALPPPPSVERRRRELDERRMALAQPRAAEPPGRSPDPLDCSATSSQEVRAFIATRSAQMEERKYQLLLIKDFIEDPTRFGIKPADIPTSTSLEEFAEKRRELQYRIAMMQTFLDVLKEELRLLDDAEAYARTNGDGQHG